MANPEEIARRALELTDRQDWSGREALMTDDCEFVTPAGALRGRAATTAYSRPIVTAVPDGHHVIDSVVAEGDVVAVEGTWIGTHLGPLTTPDGEVPPSGRPVQVPFAMILRARGDLAESIHVYFDQLGFMAQLGLVPQAQAA